MKELIAVIAVIVLGVVVGMIILDFKDDATVIGGIGKDDLSGFNEYAAEVNPEE